MMKQSFFNALKLSSRKFSSTAASNAIKHVTIVGSGTMGSGIGQVSASLHRLRLDC